MIHSSKKVMRQVGVKLGDVSENVACYFIVKTVILLLLSLS